MRYLKKAKFGAELERRYPSYIAGWFGDCLLDIPNWSYIDISARAKVETLIRRTQAIPRILGDSYPLIGFPNGVIRCHVAGWKNVPSNRKHSPIEISDPDELAQLIVTRMHFRDPKGFEDNYYITNQKCEWFALFCHHGDWHFFAPKRTVQRVKANW